MQTTKTPYQLINDFLYVNDDVLGPSYKNGSYLIGVGRNTYSCNYQGQCFSWGLEDFLSAVEACVKHAAVRRAQEGK